MLNRCARFALVVLILSVVLVLPALANKSGSLVQQTITLTLVPPQHSLQGFTTIEIPAWKSSDLTLRLAPQASINGLEINGSSVPYSFVHGMLSVPLPDSYKNRALTLRIEYSVSFTDQPPQETAISEDPSFGVSASIGSQGVFLGGGAGWYPELYQTPALFTVEVTAPAGIVAVTSGSLERRTASPATETMVWVNHHPQTSLSLAAGQFQVQESRAGEVPIYTFFYPQSADLAESYLTAVRNYLTLYQKLFGPYPFEKFAVVENFFPTGYGFPSWTLLGSSVVRLPFILTTSLGHEIAHSWWGTGIDVKLGTGNWAEGLTTYVADHLYQEQQSPADGRAYRLKILRDYASLVSAADDFPLRDFSYRINKPAQAIGYGKGAMVFHMLRSQLGDDAFWEGLRLVIAEHLYGEADWQDFRAAFEKVSGRDLQTFFDQWLNRAGAPSLQLQKLVREKTQEGWRVSGELMQTAPYYQLPVTVALYTSDSGQQTKELQLDGQTASFEFTTQQQPTTLEVDPDVTLFRRLAAEEVPLTVNAVRGANHLTVILAAGQDQGIVDQSMLLVQALQKADQPVWVETEGNPLPATGGNRLILGMPQRTELRPALPPGFSLTAAQVEVGLTQATRDGAAFIVLPNPDDPQTFTAWFYAQTPAAAASGARKIPHYGKYSYLLFENGQNIVKDIWPVTASPTRVSFSQDKE